MGYEDAATFVFDTLKADAILNGLLARNAYPGKELDPAIYDGGVPKEATLPYLVIKIDPTGSTFHFAQTQAALNLDIVASNGNSIRPNRIRERVDALLFYSRKITETNFVSVYPDPTGTTVDYPEEGYSQISWTATLKYWNNELIEELGG